MNWYNQIPYPALKTKREITKYINWLKLKMADAYFETGISEDGLHRLETSVKHTFSIAKDINVLSFFNRGYLHKLL